jgi:hypothetical protein
MTKLNCAISRKWMAAAVSACYCRIGDVDDGEM